MTNVTLLWGNATSITNLLGMANTNTGGWFWAAILITFWIVLIMSLINWRFEQAMITSSLITTMAGVMLVYVDLIEWWVLLIPFSAFMFFILSILATSTRENV